jgi:processive 1,2-diacylglycerol beta-glucosyltransferase
VNPTFEDALRRKGMRMIELRDKDTGRSLGTITEEQLRFLLGQLEEESEGDQDYYISVDTLDLFEERGIDPQLLDLLRRALGEREDMEIEWVHR